MSSFEVVVNGQPVQVFRTTNDVNGNPRYIVHFLSVARTMGDAVCKIRKIGGGRYRGKSFGGGLVFSSYSLESDLAHAIGE